MSTPVNLGDNPLVTRTKPPYIPSLLTAMDALSHASGQRLNLTKVALLRIGKLQGAVALVAEPTRPAATLASMRAAVPTTTPATMPATAPAAMIAAAAAADPAAALALRLPPGWPPHPWQRPLMHPLMCIPSRQLQHLT